MVLMNKLVVVTCYLNIVAVALMGWWAYGVNMNNEALVKQRVEQEFSRRAQEICNQCVQQFARQQGIKILDGEGEN